ncbi:hypothetical protein [Streptomyces hokutonensis]|uniref:Uncharacterized protein n=1 Tax=Streptomyces hokutonensis TaxID=1306990 RepID=A0ABW6ML17_9ACTN
MEPPHTGYWRQYDTAWVADKTRWILSVDATERDTLTQQLAYCPNKLITVAR